MMHSTIQFREATLLDVPEISRLCALSPMEEGYWRARIEGYLNFELNPHQATEHRLLYVALHKGIIIGFVAGHVTKRQEYAGQIQWITTASPCRRTGVASELLWIIAGWFIENNVQSVRVDVDPENTGARKFYQHHHASGINQYWLYWDDIQVVLNDHEPSGIHSDLTDV